MKIQLRRPSDGATSDPLDFEMLPLNEGRRSFWNLQRELKKRSATTDLFQQLLEVDNEEKVEVINFNSVNSLPLQSNNSNSNDNFTEVVVLDTPMEEDSKPIVDEKTMHWLENAEFINKTSQMFLKIYRICKFSKNQKPLKYKFKNLAVERF